MISVHGRSRGVAEACTAGGVPCNAQLGAGRCSRAAPLLFAGDVVVVSVHFYAGAVAQEEFGFRARTHLRAMLATVAAIAVGGCRSGWRQLTRGGERGAGIAVALVVLEAARRFFSAAFSSSSVGSFRA
ncbi:hypothetical protein [Nitrosomonas eutropha]|uniref:hypothetical protein n=1 Tax=Nitrosomonas eutropha TaxID=916 RepID=UPI0021093136|nr:hypothetical protein [Nitrosomonas eutropha]